MDSLFTSASLNFKLISEIGNGGEGFVHKALDKQLNSIIAIKKVPVSSFIKESVYFDEAKKLYFTKHQYIVPVNYSCRDDEFVYLAMPLYENGSIKSLMDKRFLTSRDIIRYSLQFLAGLHHIHVKNLLHFDIKPENILLSNSNQALISDFGLAEYMGRYGFADSRGTTPVLAPPEYFKQAEHNLKFDIYQAGLTIYRMCLGDVVFQEQIKMAHFHRNVAHTDHFIQALVKGNFPNRTFFYSHIPKQLRKVIVKAMNPNIDSRYQSVMEMLNDIAAIDKANDWIFETDYSSIEKWNRSEYEVTATKNVDEWEVISKKNNRLVNKYCGKKLNNSEKNTLTYECLMANW